MPNNIGGLDVNSLTDFCLIPGLMAELEELTELANIIVGQVPSVRAKFEEALRKMDKWATRDLATHIIQKHGLLPFGGSLEDYADEDADDRDDISGEYIAVNWQGYDSEEIECAPRSLAEQILFLFFRRHENDVSSASIKTIADDVEHITGVAVDDIRHLNLDFYGNADEPKSVVEFADRYFKTKRWKPLAYAIRRVLNRTGCYILDISVTSVQENAEEPCTWRDLPGIIDTYLSWRTEEKVFAKFLKYYSKNKERARKLIKKLNEFTAAYSEGY